MPVHTNKKLPLSQMKTLSAAIALAMALPLGAQAAALGKLTVLSSLGQPLRAEIDVTAVGADEAGKLTARLAPAEAFRRANMDYNPVLSSLSIVLEQRQGRHVIRISSSQPVSDPFVDLLLELGSGEARQLREYTFLLDPPDSKTPRNAQVAPLTPGNAQAATAAAAASPATPAAAPAPAPAAAPAAAAEAPAAAMAAPAAAEPAATPAPAAAPAAASPMASAAIPVSGEEPATSIVQRPAPSPLAEELIRRQQAAPENTPASASPDAMAAAPAAGPAASGSVAVPATAPAAASGGKSADYRVKPGDTLGSIANRNQQPNVSLDQMLIALYRANPDAFQGNNINRLRAGKILSIPDQPTAAAVDREEARGMVVAQAQDFNAYRNKLAGQVANAPAGKAGSNRQSGGGKITARVEERSGTQDARDRLELSRANKGRGKTGNAGAAAEDKAASERALAEANDRVKDLEKNVDNLQKLLELKNKTIADLTAQQQKEAEAAKPAAEATAAPAADKPAEGGDTKPEDKPMPAAAPAPAAVAAPATPAAAPADKSAKSGGFVDKIKENPYIVAGAGVLVALLAVGGGVLAMRRRKKKSEDGPAEPAIEPEPAPSPEPVAAMAAVAPEPEPEPAPVAEPEPAAEAVVAPVVAAPVEEPPVDPIAEADMYIAYGRDEQAEDILKLALQTQPERQALHAKLLEIYAKRGDVDNFNRVALNLHALSGGLNEAWVKAAALGLTIDPTNPLYGGMPAEPEPEPEEAAGMEFDLSDFKAAEVQPEATPAPAAAMDLGKDIDFDLDLENGAKPDADEPILPASSGAASASMLLDSLDDAPAATTLADLDLSLPEDTPAPSAANILEEDEESAFEQEMTTKLDLAAAYEEIGDKEGARELLEEVMRGGNDAQVARAKSMIAALG